MTHQQFSQFPYDSERHKKLLAKKKSVFTFLSNSETKELIYYTKHMNTTLTLDNTFGEFLLYRAYDCFISDFLAKNSSLLIFCYNLEKLEENISNVLNNFETKSIIIDKNNFFDLCDELKILCVELQEKIELQQMDDLIATNFFEDIQKIYSNMLAIKKFRVAHEITQISNSLI